MSLEALAPDQRAVVQLVLQQERSYDDLAGLLGISTEAVRERARAGLERVGGSRGDLTDEELGEISDYLLGQQSVSRREATRSLLSSSRDARRWANRVSDALVEVARSPLPGVPDEEEAGADVSPVAFAPAAEPSTSPALALPDEDDDDDDGPFVPDADEAEDEDEPEAADVDDEPVTRVREDDTEVAPVRARPRPRPAGDRPRPRPASGSGTSGTPRSSKVGGALLIAGIALFLAVAVVFILTRDGDEDERAGNDSPAATATATAEATAAPALQFELKPTAAGGKARGAVAVFVNEQQQIQFSIGAENVPPSREGEAYAIWLTGGGKPKRLGFSGPVGEEGTLAVTGPPEGSEQSFPRDFTRARRVVISRETDQDATRPGQAILRGDIPRQTGG